MITWKDTYAIGNKSIDEQHKMLFQICDKIINLQKDKESIDKYDKIMDLVSELRDYTLFHFSQEEEYMREINYEGYEEQKAEHDDFIKKLLDVNLKEIDNNQDEYIEKILVFVLEWICNHIVTKDRFIK